MRFAGGIGRSWMVKGMWGLTVGDVGGRLHPKNTDSKVWTKDEHLKTCSKCKFSGLTPDLPNSQLAVGPAANVFIRPSRALVRGILRVCKPLLTARGNGWYLKPGLRGSRFHLGSLSSREVRFARCVLLSLKK